MSPVRLELAKGLGRHLRAGHPWVFRKALEHPPRIPAGEGAATKRPAMKPTAMTSSNPVMIRSNGR